MTPPSPHSVKARISFTYSQELATDPCSGQNFSIAQQYILISSSHLPLDLPNNLHSGFSTGVFFVLFSRNVLRARPNLFQYKVRNISGVVVRNGLSLCVSRFSRHVAVHKVLHQRVTCTLPCVVGRAADRGSTWRMSVAVTTALLRAFGTYR